MSPLHSETTISDKFAICYVPHVDMSSVIEIEVIMMSDVHICFIFIFCGSYNIILSFCIMHPMYTYNFRGNSEKRGAGIIPAYQK